MQRLDSRSTVCSLGGARAGIIASRACELDRPASPTMKVVLMKVVGRVNSMIGRETSRRKVRLSRVNCYGPRIDG